MKKSLLTTTFIITLLLIITCSYSSTTSTTFVAADPTAGTSQFFGALFSSSGAPLKHLASFIHGTKDLLSSVAQFLTSATSVGSWANMAANGYNMYQNSQINNQVEQMKKILKELEERSDDQAHYINEFNEQFRTFGKKTSEHLQNLHSKHNEVNEKIDSHISRLNDLDKKTEDNTRMIQSLNLTFYQVARGLADAIDSIDRRMIENSVELRNLTSSYSTGIVWLVVFLFISNAGTFFLWRALTNTQNMFQDYMLDVDERLTRHGTKLMKLKTLKRDADGINGVRGALAAGDTSSVEASETTVTKSYVRRSRKGQTKME